MDVQELTSCILQFSTATIFDEIKLQSSVLGQPGPNSPTQVSYIFDEGPIYQGHSTETWNLKPGVLFGMWWSFYVSDYYTV